MFILYLGSQSEGFHLFVTMFIFWAIVLEIIYAREGINLDFPQVYWNILYFPQSVNIYIIYMLSKPAVGSLGLFFFILLTLS